MCWEGVGNTLSHSDTPKFVMEGAGVWEEARHRGQLGWLSIASDIY